MPQKYDIFSEQDKKAIKNFAKKCLTLRRSLVLGTNILTPSNYQTEKDKFFLSQRYNPQFTYRKIRTRNITEDLASAREQLVTLQLPKDLSRHLSRYLTGIELLSQTINAIGQDHFPQVMQKLFSVSVDNAHDVLQSLPKISFEEEGKDTLHNAEEIAQMFHDYLKNYAELCNYKIYLDTFNDHTIRVGDKCLIIGSRVKRTTRNVERLIVHEIESHILQRHNSRVSKNPLVKLIRSSDQEMFTEGLAVFNEIYTKTITKRAYSMYFYRLKAVEMLNSSFREIYTYLTNFVTPHQAFIITTRVKRGMADTSQPGGFPKDAAYLLGYEKVNQYVRDGGNLPFLYIVRQPDYGKTLAKYHLLTEADYLLPKFLNKKNLLEQLKDSFAVN